MSTSTSLRSLIVLRRSSSVSPSPSIIDDFERIAGLSSLMAFRTLSDCCMLLSDRALSV